MVAGAVTSVGRLPYTSWPGPSSKHCRVTTLQSLDCSSTPGRFSSLAVHATTPAQLPGQSAEAVARLAVMGIYSYRLVVAYDGTAYSGWQLQPSAPTVQSVMEHTLSTALRECRETLKVGAAGRTDSGVHAVGQVVHFYSNHGNLESTNTVYKLNRVLPFDVRVKAIYRTASDFNATITAIGKTYHYYIDPQPEHDPMTFRYRLHHPSPLNMGVMREAAALLVGTHDFTQFSNLVKNAPKRNPIKTLQRADIVELGDGGLRIEYEGSGFLYKQVRHMTGALLAIGQGKQKPDLIQRFLEIGSSQDPGGGGLWRGYKVAAAKGLTLHHVHYPPGVDDPSCLLYPHLPHDKHGRCLDVALGRSTDKD